MGCGAFVVHNMKRGCERGTLCNVRAQRDSLEVEGVQHVVDQGAEGQGNRAVADSIEGGQALQQLAGVVPVPNGHQTLTQPQLLVVFKLQTHIQIHSQLTGHTNTYKAARRLSLL